jgi:hypothetical protein
MSWVVERTVTTRTPVPFREKLEADLAAFQIVTIFDGFDYEVDLFESCGNGMLSCFGRIKGDTPAIKRALLFIPPNEQMTIGDDKHYNSITRKHAVDVLTQLEHLAS